MRTIRISEEVWEAIAARGKFGETEDDVLRRVFDLPADLRSGNVASTHGQIVQQSNRAAFSRRRALANQRMTSYIARNQLHIEFQDGAVNSWALPDRKDKEGIKNVLDNALSFAREHGASLGQINAARKTLTNEGYHLTK